MDPNADVPGWLAPQRVAIGILGPPFVGWVLQVFMGGICVTVFYNYVRSGQLSRDTTVIKTLAITIFCMNIAIAFFCAETIFRWGTTQQRTTDQLWSQTTLDCLQPAFAGSVEFLVQAWFTRRASMLFKRRPYKWGFIMIATLGIVAAFAGSLGITYLNFCYADGLGGNYYARFYEITNAIWLWSACLVDILNSATLCYLLKTHVVGFNEATDSLLLQIIKLSVETASYTALVAFSAAVVSASVNNDSFQTADLNYIFWVPLPSLYTLSFLTTLASRDRLARGNMGNNAVINPKYNTKLTELSMLGSRATPQRAVTVSLSAREDGDILVGKKWERRNDGQIEEV